MLTELEQSIYDYISTMDHVSCVELGNEFGKGNYNLMDKNNVISAFGLSRELVDALVVLGDTGLIFELPAHPYVYLIDGGFIDLPQVKKVPSGGYKKPHWQPTCFYSYNNAVEYIKGKTDYTNKERETALRLLKDRRDKLIKVNPDDVRNKLNENP